MIYGLILPLYVLVNIACGAALPDPAYDMAEEVKLTVPDVSSHWVPQIRLLMVSERTYVVFRSSTGKPLLVGTVEASEITTLLDLSESRAWDSGKGMDCGECMSVFMSGGVLPGSMFWFCILRFFVFITVLFEEILAGGVGHPQG